MLQHVLHQRAGSVWISECCAALTIQLVASCTQLWRLVTNYFFLGRFSIFFVVQIMWM